MGILFLLSAGLNVLFIRSYVRSYLKRERRRMREEHKRYKLAFMENLRRIHADWTPKLLESRKGQSV